MRADESQQTGIAGSSMTAHPISASWYSTPRRKNWRRAATGENNPLDWCLHFRFGSDIYYGIAAPMAESRIYFHLCPTGEMVFLRDISFRIADNIPSEGKK